MITNPPIPTIYELTWQIGSCFKSQLLQVMWEVKGKSGKALTDMMVCLPWQKLTIHVGKLRLLIFTFQDEGDEEPDTPIPDASHNKPRWCFWRFWYERRACERDLIFVFVCGKGGHFCQDSDKNVYSPKRYQDVSYKHITPGKLTWHWKIAMFNRKYIFKWWIFHCHVSLRGVYVQLQTISLLVSTTLLVFSPAFLSDEKICRSYLKSITTRSWRCHLAESIDTVSEFKGLTHIPLEDTKRTLGISFELWVFWRSLGYRPPIYVGKIMDECSWHFSGWII